MTIFAPLTGRGGAVTLLRLSGPATLPIITALAGPPPPPRRATLRTLHHNNLVLDRALLTLFPAPNSFTGEDCAEFSLHGGRAVLAAVSDVLVALGARPAEPGEFSRRAYLNGKFSLLEAEAMADLIASETEAQRRLAVEGAGALQTAAAHWRETLKQIMARQEALIDFPDEDLPPDVEARLLASIKELISEMQAALSAAPAAERLREGIHIVILGPPNAGKSTLLNTLAGEDIAITSPIPGTTRDAIGIRLDLSGIPVHLTDTAGLRETLDPIESEGIRRTLSHAKKADLILALAAPGDPYPETPPGIETLQLRTKSDLSPPAPGELAISALTGAGLAGLRATLARLAARLTDTTGAAALSRPRQSACLRDTVEALTRALQTPAPELRGEELRSAATALSRLTGAIAIEEILTTLFAGFCIGK